MRILLTLLFIFIHQISAATVPYKIEYVKQPKISWPLPLKNMHFESFDPDATLPHSEEYFVFKITPLTPTLTQDNYVFYFLTEHLASIQLCRQNNGTLVPIKAVGNDHHDASTPWGYPRFYVKGEHVYYIVTSFKKGVYFPLKFMSDPEFKRFEVKVNFQMGMFYGVATIIFIVNVIFFIFFRQRIFAFYGLFQAFIVMSIACSDGLFTFFTDDPYFLNYADIPLHIGVFVAGFFFARQFIRSPEIFRRMKFILVMAVICCLAALLLYIQSGKMSFYILAESIAFLMLCSYWLIALLQFKRNKNARLYIYAYSLYLFFAIEYYVVRQIGLPSISLFLGQLKIACVVEMVVLLISMLYRASMVLHENRYFRQKIEEYIQERSDKQKMDLHSLKIKYDLTERETAVLGYMAQGMSNPEIAEKLFVSINTVKYHLRNIFLKMEISSRKEAIAKVQLSGV